MAQNTISLTVNGEAKEVDANQTGVDLFADDKNIIAVRLNGEPATSIHRSPTVTKSNQSRSIRRMASRSCATPRRMSWRRPCRRSAPTRSSAWDL